MGLVSSLGHELDGFWDRLVSAQCGVEQISHFDASAYGCRIAAEVRDFDPTPAFPSPKELKRTDRFTHLAIYAGYKALQDSGLDLKSPSLNLDEVGAFIGSGIGGLYTTEEQHRVLLEKGPSRLSPFVIPKLILNMASGVFSIYYGLRGPNVATCSACATSTHAIGEAWRTIAMGDASVIFAGGTEAAITPLSIGGFSSMKALSTRNDDPKAASRPFDRDRDGFVMGEGSGVLVLEEMEHALARGARIYGELVGYGNTADANHLTAPSPEGEGAARCMRMALKRAQMSPEDIQYINAHGTSTPQGDICETKAIKSVFGPENSGSIVVNSTKGALGHMLGAAGAVELIVSTLALTRQVSPPTINYQTPDPECDLDYVPNEAREMKISAVMSNSFGFGGHNATVIVREFKR
jgi:3-oxoacyl-[acyl-carrier-protein] synthase II